MSANRVQRAAKSAARQRLSVDKPGPGKDISLYASHLQALTSTHLNGNQTQFVDWGPVIGASLLPRKHELRQLSEEVKSAIGVRPVSFSFPTSMIPPVAHPKTQLLAGIFPGAQYSFESASDYYAEYSKSLYALTHRKAGWDCFRHVEILAHGALPLMPDVDLVPRNTMIHYPKKLMSNLVRNSLTHDSTPPPFMVSAIADFVTSNLSTNGMIDYILETSLLSSAKRILFVDKAVSSSPDYLSLLTFIGLKERMATDCYSWFPIDYLYQDYNHDPSRLYGRGFGYSRLLSPNVRSPKICGVGRSELKKTLRTDIFDAVVVGSAPRNPRLTALILANFPPSQVILLDGEDQPPSPELLEQYADLESNVFVRELVT